MSKSSLETGAILKTFLSSLLKLQNVDRGSIWVKRGKRYLCIEALGEDSEKVRGISISNAQPSIVGWVIENGRRTIAKAGEDKRHFKQIESDFSLKSNLILCFPLILESGEVFGAIELIETKTNGNDLNLEQADLEFIENIIKVGSIAISKYFDYYKQLEENKELKKIIHEIRDQNIIMGQSQCFMREYEKLQNYAKVDYPVLITGESGTGKELFARELHRLSDRKDKPYLVQNCCAIPETLLESELFGHKKGSFTGATKDKNGLFETAHGGTVFLDEIGDMPYKLQVRLLRFIQDGEIKPVGSTMSKKVNVRIISATNVDLPEAISKRRFREDLFYRLNVLPLHLPALRDRKEDIPLLLDNFINLESKRLGINPKKITNEALNHLMNYTWKGNIRELENFVRRVIVISEGGLITMDDLPPYFLNYHTEPLKSSPKAMRQDVRHEVSASMHYENSSWEDLEKQYVIHLLEKNKWNITRCAKIAGVNRSTFDSRLKRLGIRKNNWGTKESF